MCFSEAGTSFLKRVTGFSQLVSDFIEVSRNFISDFLTRRQPEILKTLVSGASKYVHLVTLSLLLKDQNYLLSFNLHFFLNFTCEKIPYNKTTVRRRRGGGGGQ
jgi:hypothetical protein